MWAIAIICVLTLCVDMAVHAAAMLGFDPQDWVQPNWLAWLLFMGMLVGTVLLAQAADKIWKKRAAGRGEGGGEYVPPRGFKLARNVVVVYSVFMLLYYGFPCLHRGDPVERGAGQYVLDPG